MREASVLNACDDALSPLKKLIVHAHTFDFAQAVHLLQCVRPHHRLGEIHAIHHEPVKFQSVYSFKGQQPDLSYVWVPLHKKLKNEQPQPVMMVNFLSLLGVQGPLPYEVSEILINESLRRQHPDQQRGIHAFFDIFHHRLITLWFKLFCKLHPLLRQHTYGQSLTQRIFTYLTPQNIESSTADHHAMMLSSAALFWQRSRSVIGLEVIMKSLFRMNCTVSLFEGGWNTGRLCDASRLGRIFHKLGESVILGRRTFDQRKGFSIVLGPVSYDVACSFFPSHQTNTAYAILKNVLTRYLQHAHHIRVQILVIADTMPTCALHYTQGARLGYSTCLPRTTCDQRIYKVTVL